MKSIKYLIWSLALVAGGIFTACTEDDTFTPGTFDNENCVGVYFPEQKNTSGNLLFSPENELAVTYTVARTKTDSGITVPVKIEGDTSVFTISPINFAAGQKETTFTVSFDTMEEGDEASLKISFDDPKGDYVSEYTSTKLIDISILVAGWLDVDPENVITYEGEEYVGYCNYTEDVMTTFFAVDNWTYPVKVQVRSDTYNPSTMAGLYRMTNPYGEIYPANDPGDYWDEDVYILIDARDPQKVFIEQQYMGLDWGYGEFVIWSLADYYAKRGNASSAAENYGKIQNGAITFPEGSLMIAMLDYNGGGLYTANTGGAFKLVLDHTQAVEYDLIFIDSNSANGKKDIAVNFKGKDVAKIKYGIYEGSFTERQAASLAEEIFADKDAPEMTESGVLTVELEETGVYTLIAAVYDSNNSFVDVASFEFVFVAAGEEDDHVVVLSMGVDDLSSPRYAGSGYTSEDAGDLWAYGEDIVWAGWDIFTSKALKGVTEADLIDYFNDEENENIVWLEEADIAAINKGGYSTIIGDLTEGTKYTVVMYASNGYTKTLFTADYATAGYLPPLNGSYTADDMYGISKNELFKSWYMWGVDFDYGDGTRQQLSVVTFSESDNDFNDGQYDYDVINIEGLSCGIIEDDTHEWEYYDGFILNLYTHDNIGTWQGFYINYMPFVAGVGTYSFLDEMMVCGLVDEGYMAMAYSGWYNLGSNPEPNGFAFYAYTDAECLESAGYIGGLRLYDIMFEDPAVSTLSNGAKYSAKNGMPKAQFEVMAKDIMTIPANYVEKRGRERARAIIDEMNSVKSVSKTTKATDMPKAHRVDAKVTYTPGVVVKTFDKSFKANTGKAVAKL